MGCQRFAHAFVPNERESRQIEIAKTIVEQGADYVLALKGDRGDLHTDVVQLFTAARKQDFKNIEHQFHYFELRVKLLILARMSMQNEIANLNRPQTINSPKVN